MNRTVLESHRGADVVRSVVRIEDDPSTSEGMQGFMALGILIQKLAEQPYLMRHASDCPTEVHFTHDGVRWVVESVTNTMQAPE